MVKARKYVLRHNNNFKGWPESYHLKLIEEELPPVKDGEFLAEAVYISVDSLLKLYETFLKIGSAYVGTQVAKIVESKNKDFPVGKYVSGCFGWTTYTISNGNQKFFPRPILLPNLEVPLTLGVDILAMPGVTAYFGILKICKVEKGDTVVISGADSIVGSIAGQIAKIKGCKVVGITDSDEKGQRLTNFYNFDHFVNCKSENFVVDLKKITPNGVDSYFDTIGGETSDLIFNCMKPFGKVAICSYQKPSYEENISVHGKATIIQPKLVNKQLVIEGFLADRWTDWTEAIIQNLQWYKEGKIKRYESITNGIHNIFNAFKDIERNLNISTVIVKV